MAALGTEVGLSEGNSEIFIDGKQVVGLEVGDTVGATEGPSDGSKVGDIDGL